MTLHRRLVWAGKALVVLAVFIANAAPSWAGAAGITIDPAKDRTGFLSEITYRRLEAAQNAVAKEEIDRAREMLDRLLRITTNRFERAIILRSYGNILLGQDDPTKALPYLEQALQLDELPLAETTLILYAVAQIYASVENYEETIAYLDLWRPLVKEVPPEAHLLATAAYSGLKRYEPAIREVRAAIQKSPSPQEQWYQVLFALYLETKQNDEAIATIQTMLAKWPERPDYWKQLASIFLSESREREALAVYEVALQAGYLKRETEILSVSSLYLFLEVPSKAARLLEGSIETGVVKPTQKNLETLGNAWFRAQETEKAIASYRRATTVEPNPKLDLLSAQLLIDLERWDDAITSLQHLLANVDYRDQLENPGLVYVLLGNAYFETDRLAQAREAFERGLEFENVRASCAQWIESIRATEAARSAAVQ